MAGSSALRRNRGILLAMLCRLHLFRKLYARDDRLPGGFFELGCVPFGRDLGLGRASLVVEFLDLAVCEAARLGPLLVELAHHGPDQALERWIGYTMLDSFMRDAGSPEGKESAWQTRTIRGASPTTSSAR